MPAPFKPSLAAQTLGLQTREESLAAGTQPGNVVDPRAMNRERIEVFRTDAEDPNAIAPFLRAARDAAPYQVLPGGAIAERGYVPDTAPVLPRQVSLGHDATVNRTTGRHL
jgi:hypothetical protein